jgi:hypothetical protein
VLSGYFLVIGHVKCQQGIQIAFEKFVKGVVTKVGRIVSSDLWMIRLSHETQTQRGRSQFIYNVRFDNGFYHFASLYNSGVRYIYI